MASWTTQSTSSLLPGEPWTSAKALAAFENPVAITEGASGAPRIRGLAVATGDEMPTLTVTAADTYSLGGAYQKTPDALADITTSGSFVEAFSLEILSASGTVRLRAAQEGLSGTSEMRFLKNGTVVAGPWSATGATERTADISVAVGDVLSIEHRVSGGSGDSRVDNVDITASDGYTTISPLIAETDL